MLDHLVAMFRKFYLLSDKVETRADSKLQTYIRLYEWVARSAWFTGACLLGLGLGSKSKAKTTILEILLGVGSLDDVPGAASQLALSVLYNPAGIILAIVTVKWHNAYLRHVKNETEIVASCFEKDQKPEWNEISGAQYAPLIGAWLFLAFSGLCLLVGHVRWYALMAIVLNFGDFAGNDFTKNNLLKAFKKKEFRTRNKVLLARRDIALEYWAEKWQLPRILMMFMINLLALMVAFGALGPNFPDWTPYPLVTMAILINEYIIINWRLERDEKLKKYPVSESTDEGGSSAAEAKPPSKRSRRATAPTSQTQPDSGE
jgi:hypothetical protein